MTQINKPADLPRDMISKICKDDVSQIQNPALKNILEETADGGVKLDTIQAYDRSFQKYNRM